LGVDEKEHFSTSDKFTLFQNYPNPFTVSTIIPYTIKERGDVFIRVTNLTGRVVYEENLGRKSEGKHFFNFKTIRKNLSSGIYFYTVGLDKEFLIRKMVYLKNKTFH